MHTYLCSISHIHARTLVCNSVSGHSKSAYIKIVSLCEKTSETHEANAELASFTYPLILYENIKVATCAPHLPPSSRHSCKNQPTYTHTHTCVIRKSNRGWTSINEEWTVGRETLSRDKVKRMRQATGCLIADVAASTKIALKQEKSHLQKSNTMCEYVNIRVLAAVKATVATRHGAMPSLFWLPYCAGSRLTTNCMRKHSCRYDSRTAVVIHLYCNNSH